ncbi:lysostaphin resistance A-like protein [Lysobacter korlensis]|uniref:Lysostaphin resistance A-like protein n=1 Tax=Lysobacter korlensis TaxID=553636 RepID=A0ABV6RPL7_9GAMM
MSQTTIRTSAAEPAGGRSPDSPALRQLLLFSAVALPIGWAIMSVPVALQLPTEPFTLAALLFALLIPALLLTARESGRSGVKRLLRDAVRLPRPSWWGLVAMTAIPVSAWSIAAAVGGAEVLTPAVLTGYAVAFLSSTVIINILEETVWTGFVQRRSMARFGILRGSVLTAALFAGIHLPLAFSGAASPANVATGIGILLASALGLRLMVAGIDSWSGRSLLTIGVLHGSFNASSGLVEPAYDWARYVTVLALGFAVAVAIALQARRRSARR